MTFKNYFTKKLEENGMFASDAAAVIDQTIASPEAESMQGRWDDDMAGYPQIMTNIVWMTVRLNALKWIDANAPEAWFRPMFA